MKVAGEPGDRWLKPGSGGESRRYKAEAGGKSGHRPEAWQARERRPELMTWATRLITSGSWPRRLRREAELHTKVQRSG